jgi:hypothetical protein
VLILIGHESAFAGHVPKLLLWYAAMLLVLFPRRRTALDLWLI